MDVKWPAIRHALLNDVVPLTRALGKITIPHTRDLDFSDYVSVSHVIRPGDVLLSHIRLSATNLAIPGYWKHMAMFVGNDQVVEAVGGGVRSVSLEDFIKSHDAAIVLRSLFATADECALAANFAKSVVGFPYDFLIEYAQDRALNKAFYCSEVGWWSYDSVFTAEGRKSSFEPRLTMGVPSVIPQDYRNAVTKWEKLWVSKNAESR